MSNHFEGGRQVVQPPDRSGISGNCLTWPTNPFNCPVLPSVFHGYQAAMTDCDLNPRPPFVVGGPIELGYLQDQNSPTMHENIGVEKIADFLRGTDRPEAIVAMNDLVAMLVFEAAEQIGLRIPDDLGLVGFDNLDCADTKRSDNHGASGPLKLAARQPACCCSASAEITKQSDKFAYLPN